MFAEYQTTAMISAKNPWKNSWTIRLVAAIDMAFACFLVSIYLQRLLAPIPYEMKLFLLGPVIFNSFQIVMSFNLFSAARRGSPPVISYAKATTWFQFSTVMLVFLMLKLFLILWFPPYGSISRKDIFGATMIVLETVFKIFGLFIVKEFIDDLKCILSMFPSPQYYCIYTNPPPPPPLPPVVFPSEPSKDKNVNANANSVCENTTLQTVPTPPLVQPLTQNLKSSNRNSAIIAIV